MDNWSWVHRLGLGLALLGSLGYAVGLGLDWPSWVRGSNWTWVRRVPDLSGWRMALLLAVFLLGLGLFYWAQRDEPWGRGQTAVFLLAAVSLSIGVQLTIAAQHRVQPLAVSFWAGSGFWLTGVQIDDPVAFMQAHLTAMPGYRDVHMQTQPPGWPLLFWGVAELLERWPTVAEPLGHQFRRYDCLRTEFQGLSPAQMAAAIVPMMVLLSSGLGVLPLFGLGRRLFSARVGRMGAAVFPFLPGFLVFQGRFDVLYAVVTLVALWLTAVVLLDERRWPLGVLGLLLGGITFLGFGTLAIILVVNLFLLSYGGLAFGRRRAWRDGLAYLLHPVGSINGAIGLVLVALWGGLWLGWGVNGWAMFQTSQELHQAIRINYPVWTLFNLYDAAVFMGIPLAVGSVVALGRLFFASGDEGIEKERLAGWALVLGWGTAVLLLNLSGQVRAETGRLWLFLLAPGLLVGVVGWWGGQRRLGRRGSGLLAAGLMVQALTTGCFLGGRTPPPTVPEPTWRMGKTAVVVDHTLNETIRLRGVEQKVADASLSVTLYWEAVRPPLGDYSAFVHLIAPNGEVVAQSDGAPQGGQLPTWCWVAGEVVADTHTLPLDGLSLAGYTVGAGLYDWRTGERLAVQPPVLNEVILLPAFDGE